MSEKGKRVTIKLKCPNPLFEEWLITWRDQAFEKGSKMHYSFNNALQSLRKYPLPLESGRDCKILKGFGDKLCSMLDDKLKEYKNTNGGTEGGTKVLSTHSRKSNSSNKVKNIMNNSSNSEDQLKSSSFKSGKSSTVKEYMPQYGSGGYAILVTLYKQSLQDDYAGFLNKADIIKYGKELVNCSFTKPDPGLRYTAWSSMRTLISKGLVKKASHPPKFSLTNEGNKLAKRMYEKSADFITTTATITNLMITETKQVDTGRSISHELPDDFFVDHWVPEDFGLECHNRDNSPDKLEENLDNEKVTKRAKKKQPLERIATDPSLDNPLLKLQGKKEKSQKKFSSFNTINSVVSKTSSSNSVFEDFIMTPFSFDIILYVDNCETSGSLNSETDDILVGLSKSGIKYEVKDLKVGDFTWICRDRLSKNELVLPYIIERKRMDDFAHSIKDKRYYEQKFRLKRSGIENLIYLIESYGKNQHCSLPVESLLQAASNTAIQEDYFIKFTENTKETMEYLVTFSKHLIQLFKSKSLKSCLKSEIVTIDYNRDQISLITFKEFNETSVKNKRMMITDLFVKMLIQIKGMSVERALAVTQKYPTPISLKTTYEGIPTEVGEKLLSTIKYGSFQKPLGAMLSKTVYQVFCRRHY